MRHKLFLKTAGKKDGNFLWTHAADVILTAHRRLSVSDEMIAGIIVLGISLHYWIQFWPAFVPTLHTHRVAR